MRKKSAKQRTPAEVKEEFVFKGTTISGWAREHQIGRHVVYGLLSGRLSGRSGQPHKAAVLLGLKRGTIVT